MNSAENKKRKLKQDTYNGLIYKLRGIIDKGGSFEDLDFNGFDEVDRKKYIKALKTYIWIKKSKGIDL